MTDLYLYNTMTRSKEIFVPITQGKALVYTCGLTVYSQPHIGNWVPFTYWDILVRTLKANNIAVTRVQNITDVGHLTSDEDSGEDKMQKGARQEGMTAWDVAEKYSAIAASEATQLALLPPDHLVRATDYIDEQIAFVQELERRGYTYQIEDGIYFDTSKLPDYGKLARLDIAGLQAGARVVDTGKRNPTDFALWKLSPKNEKRDMEWPSPWGVGFPGWHLECSVMARELLGDQIDIHTGGIDHIPIHHTNEIAQTEAITGTTFATFWLHNNHLKMNGKKMAKSLGTIVTLNDILERGYELSAFKLAVLSKHYRTEGNFTWDILEAANNRLQRWRNFAQLRWQFVGIDEAGAATDHKQAATIGQRIVEALNDDLNTPQAITRIDEALDEFESDSTTPSAHAIEQFWLHVSELLGLDVLESTPDITSEQRALIIRRDQVRARKDFVTSDALRDQLLKDGITLLDASSRSLWRR